MYDKVEVFFYGGFMSPSVLSKHGVTPGRVMPARLNGFELTIRPRANLSPSDRYCAYGVIAEVTHEDLDRLYSDIKENFGLTYVPIPMQAELLDGSVRPVLCYVVPDVDDGPATIEYVDQLAEAVRAAGLPEWYRELVESYRPDKSGQA